MKVILLDNYFQLGFVGDSVEVRPGYARNFLIPQGLAIEASDRNERVLKHRLGFVLAKKARLKKEAEETALKLQGVSLQFTIKIGEGGKAFGAVSHKEIEKQLTDKGFTVDKTQIKLQDAVRKSGEYKVGIKLHADVLVTIPMTVTAEVPKKAAEEGEDKGKKKRGGPRRKRDAATDDAPTTEAAPATEKA
jgi:large subunit ribosomal protein L9